MKIRNALNPEKTNTATDQVTIAIILAALLLFAATLARAASLDEMLAKRKPEATINLASKEGVQSVKASGATATRRSSRSISKRRARMASQARSLTERMTLRHTPAAPTSTTPSGKSSIRPRSTNGAPPASSLLTGTGSRSPCRSASGPLIPRVRLWSSRHRSTITRKSGSIVKSLAPRARAAAR